MAPRYHQTPFALYLVCGLGAICGYSSPKVDKVVPVMSHVTRWSSRGWTPRKSEGYVTKFGMEFRVWGLYAAAIFRRDRRWGLCAHNPQTLNPIPLPQNPRPKILKTGGSFPGAVEERRGTDPCFACLAARQLQRSLHRLLFADPKSIS